MISVDKLFNTLGGSYHDGALIDAQYEDGNLCVYCFRNPPDPDGKERFDTRHIIIRFEDVTDLEIYDWEIRDFAPYSSGALDRNESDWAIAEIDYLDYEEGFVVFGQCLRFHCEDVLVLASSSEELDFEKYCNR